MTSTAAIPSAAGSDPRGRPDRGLDPAAAGAPRFDDVLADIGGTATQTPPSPPTADADPAPAPAPSANGTGALVMAATAASGALSVASGPPSSSGTASAILPATSPANKVRTLLERLGWGSASTQGATAAAAGAASPGQAPAADDAVQTPPQQHVPAKTKPSAASEPQDQPDAPATVPAPSSPVVVLAFASAASATSASSRAGPQSTPQQALDPTRASTKPAAGAASAPSRPLATGALAASGAAGSQQDEFDASHVELATAAEALGRVPASVGLIAEGPAAAPQVAIAAVATATHLAPKVPSAPRSAALSAASEQPSAAAPDEAAAKPSTGASLAPSAADAATSSANPTTATREAPARSSEPAAALGASAASGEFPSLDGGLRAGDQAASEPTPAPSGAAAVATPTATTPPAPARSMTLQLNPANLGTVNVRLHLTADALDVRLAVADPKTLGLIDHDRDALSAAIGDQAYRLNSLTIQGADAASAPTAGQHDSGTSGSGDPRTNQDRASGGASQREGQSRRAPQGEPAATQRAPAAARAGGGDDLFV